VQALPLLGGRNAAADAAAVIELLCSPPPAPAPTAAAAAGKSATTTSSKTGSSGSGSSSKGASRASSAVRTASAGTGTSAAGSGSLAAAVQLRVLSAGGLEALIKVRSGSCITAARIKCCCHPHRQSLAACVCTGLHRAWQHCWRTQHGPGCTAPPAGGARQQTSNQGGLCSSRGPEDSSADDGPPRPAAGGKGGSCQLLARLPCARTCGWWRQASSSHWPGPAAGRVSWCALGAFPCLVLLSCSVSFSSQPWASGCGSLADPKLAA
jgi:hypothetical protein